MIHPRLAPVIFGLLLSGFMSLIVSGVATLRAVGLPADFFFLWMSAWVSSWMIAFPAVLLIAPRVRRFVDRNTRR